MKILLLFFIKTAYTIDKLEITKNLKIFVTVS